jgi:hypothetical protein
MGSIKQFKANNKRGPYKPRVKAKVDSNLLLEEENRAKLTELLTSKAPGVIEEQWDLSSEERTRQRDQFFRENGLDIHHDDVRCKWSIRRSNPTTIVRQCIGGSYRQQVAGPTSRLPTARYPYVGCLAFVTISIRNNSACGVTGYLQHLEACKASQPMRDPVYRLIPQVKKSVENLLSLNVSTADILARNAQTVTNVYKKRTLIKNHRTLLTAQDVSNIKNEMLRKNWDIDVRQDAARNLERFLGPDADETELKTAALHYKPRRTDADRLEIIISTPEQQEYAWKYGHQSLILLDGTFGISKHKLLLFIIMVIDNNGKGIPITFIIFTPPPNNRLTAVGYDSEIIERLLTIFRDKISAAYSQNLLQHDPTAVKVTFNPLVAMTDADVKERGPLSRVWPGIFLLLCYFHLGQCWKNEMNKRLGRGGEDSAVLQRQTLRAYLRSVLKEAWTTDGTEDIVRQFISRKKESLKNLVSNSTNLSAETQSVLNGGIEFLTYVQKQWAGDLLYSWSLNGRKSAAGALGIPLENLPTTNNHLEGTNEYLKNNQLRRFQRKGRPLRADVLYFALVSEIIPNILALRSLAVDLKKEKAERRKEFNIMDNTTREILEREYPQVAYLSPSPNRDESAKRILRMNKVLGYEVEEMTGKVQVQVESETTPDLVYITCVHGKATDIRCQCPDFLQNGILCKHLRAAALYIDELRKQEEHSHLPEMMFTTRQEARNIRRNLNADRLRAPAAVSSNTGVNDASESGDETDDEDEDAQDSQHETVDQDDDMESSISNPTSSEDVLDQMERILGIAKEQGPKEAPRQLTYTQAPEVLRLISLNASAICKQETDHFVTSASRSLQAVIETSVLGKNLFKVNQSSEELTDNVNQRAIATHLCNVISSESFLEAQRLVDLASEVRNPRKRTAFVANILPLEQETKQRRHPSYASR